MRPVEPTLERLALAPLLLWLCASGLGAACTSTPEVPPAADAAGVDATRAADDAGPAADAAIAADASTDAGVDAGAGEDVITPDTGGLTAPLHLPREPQRPGDATRGYRALLDEGYVGCGVPYSAYRTATGPAPANRRLPRRNAANATLPYNQTRFTTTSSVEVVTPNCLTCHASVLDDQVVVGLGNAGADFTNDPSATADLVGFLLTDPAEIAEWQKWAGRIRATSPFIQMPVLGANPADNLAAALFAHRDRATLAWSDMPLLELPPTTAVPVDVPAWWTLSRKSSMFYVGGGRGDHARIMMTASTLCVDTVAEAEAIDAYFPDVRAYLESLTAPAWPFAVDAPLADRGRGVFEATCARCHGTYGDTPSYPDLVIPLADVGTDAALAAGSAQYAARFTDWFNGSWYGQRGRLEPQQGYIPPPLVGVWATAPYLHNGSVPTIAALLDSRQRPAYWTRSFGTRHSDYDAAALGWQTTVVDHGHAGEPDRTRRVRLYDTTLPGYGNGGHTYGDALSEGDRSAVLEYLKTL